MNDVIISTEGSLKGYTVAQVISSVVSLLLGLFSVCMCFCLLSFSDNQASYLLLVLGILCMIFGFSSLFKSMRYARTYIRIYPDRMEGIGLNGTSIASFNVQYSQVTSISTDKDWILIYTAAGTFKVFSKRKLVQQIFDYYNRYILPESQAK